MLFYVTRYFSFQLMGSKIMLDRKLKAENSIFFKYLEYETVAYIKYDFAI